MLTHELKIAGMTFAYSFVAGVLAAFLFPSLSQAFIGFAMTGTAAVMIVPIISLGNALVLGLEIF